MGWQKNRILRGNIINILITGATGFIGMHLIAKFNNHNITILTRNKQKAENLIKNDKIKILNNLEDITTDTKIDVIINLAGAKISKRWSNNYKNTLITSRTNTSQSIVNLVNRLSTKPKKIISASAIGYYGNQAGDITEESKPHQCFTNDLCSQWEKTISQCEGTNIIIIRLGVVLGLNQGILKETTPIFKLGLGGKIASGEQYLSWVHIFDVVEGIAFLIENEAATGVYNLTAPQPVTNSQWTNCLAKTLQRPAILPLPKFLIKLIFGEMGLELLANGVKVLPKRLTLAGFSFKFNTLEKALLNIYKD